MSIVIHNARLILLMLYIILLTPRMLYADKLSLYPDKLPFKSWGELRESKGDEPEGMVLDIYAEQGITWKIDKTELEFMPFVAGILKQSDQPEDFWNNHWKTLAGIKLKRNFVSDSGKNTWYDGEFGIQFDVNFKHYTSGLPATNPATGREIKVYYYVGGDWKKQ